MGKVTIGAVHRVRTINYCAMPAKKWRKKACFSTRLRRCSWVRMLPAGATWHATSHCTGLPHLRCWLRAALPGWHQGLESSMLLELFCMLTFCCSSEGPVQRAMVMHMRRMGQGGRSLLVEYFWFKLLPMGGGWSTRRSYHTGPTKSQATLSQGS